MGAAAGTTTLTRIGEIGQATMWRIRNTSVATTNTIALNITGSPMNFAGSQIIIVGALSEYAEKQTSGNDLDIEYDETNMRFTVTETSLATSQVDIYFLATDTVKADLD